MTDTARPDQQLTKNFRLYELTVTSNANLQEQNRILDDDQLRKLGLLAQFAEGIRHLCGDSQMRIHSGYRCDAVNGATPGSSSTSQHPRCEAIDFDIPGQDLETTFQTLIAAAKDGKFCFGQLIMEAAHRDYGVARWVHASVVGTLDPEKVGAVERAEAGADNVFVYQAVDKINFPA